MPTPNVPRMGFSHKFTVSRKIEDRASNDIAVWNAINEPQPNRSDVHEIVAAVAMRFPDRRIYADTAEGLVLVHSPARTKETATA